MAKAQPVAGIAGETLRGRVLKLALPAVGEQLLNTLVGLADVFMVGNLSLQAAAQLGYTSDAALNAVGLGNQMIWLTMVLFMAVGVGSTALIARAVGAENPHDMRRFLHHSMLVALAVGALGTASVFFGAPGFLWLLGASSPDMAPEVLPLGVEYLRIISSTIMLAAMLFVGTACMRGAGDTRTPLYVMLGVNASNVLITWLLVSGNLGFPSLGVPGAALGTAIARGGGALVVLWLLWRGRSGLHLDFRPRPDMDIIRRLLNIGLPTAGEMFIFHAALLIFTRFVTSMGTVSYAAHIATINIEALSFLPGMGYAVAAGALVGQGLGAAAPRRAEESAYEALWQGMAFMTIVGATMVIFPDALLSIFVNDPAVVETGTAPLRAAGLVQPALAVNFILNGALRGAGDTRWTMFSRLLGTWAVRLPLTALLLGVAGMGLNGIWLAMCADFTTQAMLALWRFGSGRWQSVQV